MLTTIWASIVGFITMIVTLIMVAILVGVTYYNKSSIESEAKDLADSHPKIEFAYLAYKTVEFGEEISKNELRVLRQLKAELNTGDFD